MADFRLTTVLLTLVLLHGFLIYVCRSCSPPEGWRPPTLVDKILKASNVLYGVVRETYPDDRFSTAYTVELEVYCILKGATTPSVINITGAGWIPGLCESSDYLVGHEYVVRAYNQGTAEQPLQLTISSSDINATQENLQGITKACGLNPVTRPTGSSSEIECPVSALECQSEPTPYLEPMEPIPTEQKDHGDTPKLELQSDDKSSASAMIVTDASTTLTAAATAALVLNKIIG